MKKVLIRENTWIAKLAARKLGSEYAAIVIGKTIYLYNASREKFLNRKSWIIHELKHVEQYEEHGFLGFLWKYFIEYLRNGYYHNRFEAEARAAEEDERLLEKYKLCWK